ncbi:hypothetical protein C8J57DRAFT_1232426 [Mycena rebaudengoi]|nr:hypothetical protein C8J57DRAFT_1232426 [Mycena rebaudengoi]
MPLDFSTYLPRVADPYSLYSNTVDRPPPRCRQCAWTFQAPGELETFVETWFRRARILPRSFGFLGVMDNAHDHTLNTILVKHAPYLREISVDIDSDFLLSLRGGTPFPALHHLEIGDVNGSWGTGAPSDAFRLAPRLQSLSLLSVPPAASTLPWEQLTTLYAQSLDVEECLSVLRMAPCLREFRYNGDYETQTTPGPPFPHPGLISLEITGPAGGGINPFLVLPNLQRLQLHNLSALPDDAIPLQFISSSSLHTFIFGYDTPVTLP